MGLIAAPGAGAQAAMNVPGGNDNLSGDNGDDELFGGPANDLVKGENGNDFLVGNFGSDLLLGGRGDDGLVGDAFGAPEPGPVFDICNGQQGTDLAAPGTCDLEIQIEGALPPEEG